MTHEVPVFWHYAVNLLHRQVALASFLRKASDAHYEIYYAARDPAGATIVAVCVTLGIVATAWEGGLHPTTKRPWVWIQSHAPTTGHPLPCSETLEAVLCLDRSSPDEEAAPRLPLHHEPFLTGMGWSSASVAPPRDRADSG